MQIGGEGIESIFMNMALEAKTLREQKFEERSFNAPLFWTGLNKFKFGIVHMMTTAYET
jgi:hypothetical protein